MLKGFCNVILTAYKPDEGTRLPPMECGIAGHLHFSMAFAHFHFNDILENEGGVGTMIIIGTAGYSYVDWIGPVYPEGTDVDGKIPLDGRVVAENGRFVFDR